MYTLHAKNYDKWARLEEARKAFIYFGLDAERQTGHSQANITAVCNGKRKSTGGYIWRHLEIKGGDEWKNIRANA